MLLQGYRELWGLRQTHTFTAGPAEPENHYSLLSRKTIVNDISLKQAAVVFFFTCDLCDEVWESCCKITQPEKSAILFFCCYKNSSDSKVTLWRLHFTKPLTFYQKLCCYKSLLSFEQHPITDTWRVSCFTAVIGPKLTLHTLTILVYDKRHLIRVTEEKQPPASSWLFI